MLGRVSNPAADTIQPLLWILTPISRSLVVYAAANEVRGGQPLPFYVKSLTLYNATAVTCFAVTTVGLPWYVFQWLQ